MPQVLWEQAAIPRLTKLQRQKRHV
jgi:hypothetical protein